jgi:uncharacterized protein YjbI with pentapeptide repeats/lysophospholipase L1-like esterase
MSVQVSYKKQFTLGLLLLLLVVAVVEGISLTWWHNIETCAFEQSDVYADLHPEKKRQMCIQTYEVQYSVSNIDPNQHFSTININTEGFRGKDISPLKPDDTFRIFIIGGSTVYGTGAESDITTMPGFLQMEFDNHDTGYNVEIVNAGISGAWSFSEIQLIKNKILNLQPDMLVIFEGWNDLGRFSNVSTDESDITSWTNTWKDRWTEICQIGHEQNFQTIITLQPFVGTGNKSLSEEEFSWFLKNDHSRLLKLYESYNQQLSTLEKSCSKTEDLRNTFDDHNDETIFWDSVHVGNKGNSILGKKLFEVILPQLPASVDNISNDNFVQQSSVSEESRNILIDDIVYVAKKNILPYYKTPMAIKHILLTSGEWSTKPSQLITSDNFDFTQQNLSEKNFSKSYLSQIDLSEKNLSYTDLSYSNLSNADLSNADLSNADLTGSILVGANLSGANLTNVKVHDADLRNTNLKYSNLSFVDLSSSRITGADARNSNLSNAILQSHHISEMFLDGANLSNADLSFTVFRSDDLSGADLSGADLSYSDLTYSSLAFSNLTGVEFIGADLSGADLSGADLQNSNMSLSILFNTDLSGANLEDVILKNTNLSCINHEICN